MATINGTSGNDTGNNTLQGTAENDIISGLAGNDSLEGGNGEDTLIGGSGKDTLVGGFGNDTLTDNAGDNTFVLYYSGGGIDTITNFSVSQDFILVTSAPINSVDGRLNSNLVKAEDAFIDNSIEGGSSSRIRIEGVLKYNKRNGALFYGQEQIAWLPRGLNLSGDNVGLDASPTIDPPAI